MSGALPPLAATAVLAPLARTIVLASIFSVCSNDAPPPLLPLMVIQSLPIAFTTPFECNVVLGAPGLGIALISVAWSVPFISL